jgi:hypothetical protein
MSDNRLFLGAFLLLSLVAFLFYQQKQDLKNSIKESLKSVEQIEKDGVVLQDLRDNWQNKSRRKKEIRAIERFSPKPSTKTKGNKMVVEFSELNRKQLDKLAKKLFRSRVVYRSLQINRIDEHRVQLKVELDR